MNSEGPPQEGLDPKLKALPDLAPADEEDAIVEESIMEFGASIDVPDDGDGAPLLEADGTMPLQEQPPQVGQDPKLLACVNDGDDNAREEEIIGAAAAADPEVVDHGAAPSAISAEGVHDENGGQATFPAAPAPTGNDAPASDGDAAKADPTVPPSPTKVTVAATMLAIHQNPTEPSQEAASSTVEPSSVKAESEKVPTPTSSSATKANANPNLTSSESLAEWNRIHANTGPTYNFFKKSQEGQKMNIAEINKEPAADGGPSPEAKVENLTAHSTASTTAPSDQKPLFTLNAGGVPTLSPTAHEGSVPHQAPPHSDAMPNPINPHAPAPSSNTGAPPALPALAVPPAAIAAAAANTERTNSNFWLQEEEERFLLGLRLYGWGQWKRIQTIVQTRTNKQIKSHAQKREKVNPEIKAKYGKGKARRGRISSKVLAEDARAMAIAGGSVGEVANAILQNDATIPSLDQAWKDVYGTNNTDGPNSRTRRYRQHSKFVSQANRSQLALLELSKLNGDEDPSQLQQLSGTNSVAMVPHRSLEESLANPLLKQPAGAPMQHYHQHMDASRPPGMPPPNHDLHAPTQQQVLNVKQDSMPSLPPGLPPPSLPPPIATVAGTPAPAYASTADPLPSQPTAAIANHQSVATTNTTAHTMGQQSPSKQTDTTTLRPGMRIYSRTGKSWSPGSIYSAKVDPAKLAKQQGSVVPLIYHIQFDNGNEDPNVPEENVMSKKFYEDLILELEKCHALPPSTNTHHPSTHPFEMGTPVYCQWMDMHLPEMHGRWLPGTINSYQKLNDGEFTYHILFDNDQEKQGMPQKYVLDRTGYHELTKIKYQTPQEEGMRTRPIGEIYNLFLRKENNNVAENIVGQQQQQQQQQQPGASQANVAEGNAECNDPNQTENGGQLNLLFTASQIATSNAPAASNNEVPTVAVTKKREATVDLDHSDHKKQREEQDGVKEEQQQATEPGGSGNLVTMSV